MSFKNVLVPMLFFSHMQAEQLGKMVVGSFSIADYHLSISTISYHTMVLPRSTLN